MAFAFILPLRAVQAVLAIIVLGLTAYVVDAWNGPYNWGWSPSSVNFLLFCSIWTLLAVAYLIVTPSRFPQFAHKFAILAVEAVTMIFWFAGWVAVAALWGDIGCGSRRGVCGAGTAAIVFGAIEWLTFVATTVMAAMHVKNTRNGTTKHDPRMEVEGV
ncbi:membrane-associating domain-domain-containing protein [Clohesyomyces aquaticus]|uniref:Membrane-associating domain-domain-containing protein n=1 Tax=Clohesyomyces aquaticus TaxID=1231657 RepID=A0A1Y2A3A6_9PLEO|nr:membrane-associating domain-domain-containing protein [Clohesyomyces aquaticus]